MADIVITIFGSGKAKEDDEACRLAARTAELLARAGFSIANGGYSGTMLAAAKAAKNAGANVIGVTCSQFSSSANQYITGEIQTATLDERLNKLIEIGRAYIVLPGLTGTLLELAKVWELKCKGFNGHQKPVILIGRFWKPVVELITATEPRTAGALQIVDNPVQAVDVLVKYFEVSASSLK